MIFSKTKKVEEVILGADAMAQVITPQMYHENFRPILDDDMEKTPLAWEVIGWLVGFCTLGYMAMSAWAYQAIMAGEEVHNPEFWLAPFIWATGFFG